MTEEIKQQFPDITVKENVTRKDVFIYHLVNHFQKNKISTPSKTEEGIPEELKEYKGPPIGIDTPTNIIIGKK